MDCRRATTDDAVVISRDLRCNYTYTYDLL